MSTATLTPAQNLIRREALKALEDSLYVQLRQRQAPEPEREYAFAPNRKFRADFAWPTLKVLAEVEGGTWTGGRHVTGAGFERDTEKYNLAAELGWRVYRYTAKAVKSGAAANQLTAVLSATTQAEG